MRRRVALLLYATAVILLVSAPVAFAHDGGEGYYGEIDDQIRTLAGFAVILFFPIFIFVASMIQGHLEKRKHARLAAAKARAKSPEWGQGW